MPKQMRWQLGRRTPASTKIWCKYMGTWQTVAALAGIALGIGCGTRLPPAEIPSDTQNRIAVCTGGYSTSATREIVAEISRRSGGFIDKAETEEKGVDTFAFGEQRGQTAVDMYNKYVECITAERESARTSGDTNQAPRWKYHEIGITPSGEPVVQTPMPGQERNGDEIQLQIVTPEKDTWSSRGTPLWQGYCNGELQQVGNDTSYTYRFFTFREGLCRITLYAMEDATWPLWSEEFHIHVRE